MILRCCIALVSIGLVSVADAGAVGSISFTSTSAELSAKERTQAHTRSRVIITDASGKTADYAVRYQALYHTDDTIPAGRYADQYVGGLIGADAKPILDRAGKPIISDIPDGNTLIIGKQGQVQLLSHFEYASRDSQGKGLYLHEPMFTGVASLDQPNQTGRLVVTGFEKHRYAEIDGLWTPCLASATPWGSVLSNEEYEPDARLWAMGKSGKQAGLNAMPYMQDHLEQYPAVNSVPYRYGHIVESELDATGQIVEGIRHYSLGRFSHEKIVMMPDQQTFYMSDDVDFAGFFMAIADKPGDLSANTLYAAKWEQKSSSGGGRADLQWIRLGHASDSEIKKIMNQGISFLDIFDTAPVPAIGFVTVRVGQGHKREYLRLKPGMETAAAFLETRRYAAYLGATTEFSKPEGMTLNLQDRKLYLAMSNVAFGMANDHGHIRLDETAAGAVYEVLLNAKAMADQSGSPINSDWVAGSMHAIPALTGIDHPKADQWGNTADVDAIANPDNLSFSPSSRYLFIGEDSSKHVNNYVWAWHVDSGQLVRLLSMPAGAEVGGLQIVENLNGFMYILCNYQHPGGKGAATDALELSMAKANPDFDAGRYRHAGVGYLLFEDVAANALPWMKH